MGISKIFQSKKGDADNHKLKYEESKEQEEDEIFANRERSSSLVMNESGGDLKLIDDEEELAKAAQVGLIESEIVKDTQLTDK